MSGGFQGRTIGEAYSVVWEPERGDHDEIQRQQGKELPTDTAETGSQKSGKE